MTTTKASAFEAMSSATSTNSPLSTDSERYGLTLEGEAPIATHEHNYSDPSAIKHLPPRLPPLLYSNRNAPTVSGGWHGVTRTLESSFASKLKAIETQNGVSLTAFYLTGLGVMVNRILDIDAEFCVALEVPDTGLLPVRLHPSPTQSVGCALKNTEKELTKISHFGSRFSEKKDLFSTIVLSHEIVGVREKRPGIVSASEVANGVEINMKITENTLDGSIEVGIGLKKSLYTQYDARLLIGCFVHVAQAMTDITLPLIEVSLYARSEAWGDLKTGRGPQMVHPWPLTLIHKIDEVIESQPDAIAVEDDTGKSWTYSALSDRVQRISYALLKLGVTAGSPVAVFCEPGIDPICAQLAITRIAAIYVPLDLNHPMERLALIVDDSKPHAIIAHASTIQKISGLQYSTKVLDVTNLPTKSEPVPIACTASDAAFVLYTSGSTGRPKGVLLSHENFQGQIASFDHEYRLHKERVLQQSSLGFDVSLHQTFVALTSGGTLVIATNAIRREPCQLAELMRVTRVTFTLGVPSEYAILLRYGKAHLQQCSGWRYAVCGGERMTVSLKQAFRELGSAGPTLVSCYGPTEVSLASSYGVLSYTDRSAGSEDENSPVGVTLPNYAVYILDNEKNPVPTGFPGEVYVSGIGVALGYLNDETRTKQRFSPDPFDRKKSRMYRTGDRGRLLPDGSLAFLGRMEGDFQIKLRGIRIELDEVTNTIVTASGGVLRQAAVVLRGTENKYLLAFVVFSQGWVGDKKRYLTDLLARLPLAPSMRPAMLVPLDRLPTNVNGKLDRRALDDFVPETPRKSHQPKSQSGNTIEDRLKDVWKEVLAEAHSTDAFDIRPDSDFFQVGGNSLLLVRLQAALTKAFDVTIPIRDLFQISVLRDMSARLTATRTKSEEIVWDEEVKMHLQHFNSPLPCIRTTRIPHNQGSQVLLTGATGFLGRHILKLLVADSTVHTIHCLAVRSHSLSSKGTLAGISSPKIQVWPGDLSKPCLGLMGSTFTRLAQSIDVIIHNGADVSFLKTYSSLRAPNVTSSVELARMALVRNTPLHYVSSAGVLRLATPDSGSELGSEDGNRSGYSSSSENEPHFYPPTNGSDGYIASKWASEQVLDQGRSFGLRAHIHRPTTLIGDGVPSTDLLHNVLQYSRLLQAVPRFDGSGVLDMVSVEEVAQNILACSRGNSTGGITCHSGTQLPISNLDQYLSETEEPLKVLDMEGWVHEAIKIGLNSQVASILLTQEGRKGHGLVIPEP